MSMGEWMAPLKHAGEGLEGLKLKVVAFLFGLDFGLDILPSCCLLDSAARILLCGLRQIRPDNVQA